MKWSEALQWLDEVDDTQNSEISDNGDVCLIGRHPIEHKLELPCGHSFEYINLFRALTHDLRNGKYRVVSPYYSCPYCRKKHDGFIPYYDIPEMQSYKSNLNRYHGFKNNILTCTHTLVSGKNKGKKCGKCAHRYMQGDFCKAHHNHVVKHKSTTKPKYDGPLCGHLCKNGKKCMNKPSKKYDNGKCGIHAKMI